MKGIKRYIKSTDLTYIAMCVICSCISVMTLISIGYYRLGDFRMAIVQAGASAGGILCAIILSLIDYRALVNFWPFHMALTWGLVALTFIRVGPFGKAPYGTSNFSWIELPFNMSLQPTELAKISFIMTFAMHLDNVHTKVNQPTTLLKLLLHMGVPVLIVHFQGDDGTAIVFAAIGCMMLFAAGLNFKYILSAVAAVAVTVPALIVTGKMKPYQIERIIALFDPENPLYATTLFQQNMGRIAIGAGQINGRGLFGPDHYYVPKAYNDFIFSYMAEAFGFIGAMGIVVLLFAIAIKTLTTGLRANDRVGAYICVGIFATFAWQIVINLGMNLTLLPVIGVTLPFFSQGGTSVLTLYLCVGLVLSVYKHNKKSLFD